MCHKNGEINFVEVGIRNNERFKSFVKWFFFSLFFFFFFALADHHRKVEWQWNVARPLQHQQTRDSRRWGSWQWQPCVAAIGEGVGGFLENLNQSSWNTRTHSCRCRVGDTKETKWKGLWEAKQNISLSLLNCLYLTQTRWSWQEATNVRWVFNWQKIYIQDDLTCGKIPSFLDLAQRKQRAQRPTRKICVMMIIQNLFRCMYKETAKLQKGNVSLFHRFSPLL